MDFLQNRVAICSACCGMCSPPTALRMLEEFVALQPGDTVIQNGANSAVGRAVIQLCRAAGTQQLTSASQRNDSHELMLSF